MPTSFENRQQTRKLQRSRALRHAVDGRLFKQHEPGAVGYDSLCGTLDVSRWTHREVGVRNGPTLVPMELAAGLLERASSSPGLPIGSGTARTARSFAFIPLWGFAVVLFYCVRRVECRSCGVHAEYLPWADGKQRTCNVYRQLLARWARRLSWSEVAEVFGTSWGVVYRAVEWIVEYGLAHRSLGKASTCSWPT